MLHSPKPTVKPPTTPTTSAALLATLLDGEKFVFSKLYGCMQPRVSVRLSYGLTLVQSPPTKPGVLSDDGNRVLWPAVSSRIIVPVRHPPELSAIDRITAMFDVTDTHKMTGDSVSIGSGGLDVTTLCRVRGTSGARSETVILTQSSGSKVSGILHVRARMVTLQSASSTLLSPDSAATIIQSAWRGCTTRHTFAASHIIAAAVSSYCHRRQWVKLRARRLAAAKVIQTAWLRFLQRRIAVVQQYAATAITAGVRGFIARQHLRKQQRSAVVFQALWRQHNCRREYAAIRQAITKLQASARRKHARRVYIQQREAATLLASLYRGHCDRKAVRAQHDAASLFAAAWRRVMARKQFLELKQSVTVLQARFRGSIAKQQYNQTKAAVTTVSRCYRGYVQRSSYGVGRRGVIQAQALIRAKLQHRRFLKLRHAVTMLASWWRMKMDMIVYQCFRNAVVAIQTAFRCHAARKSFLQQRAAATTISAMYRGHTRRTEFNRQRIAAILFQAAFKRKRAAKQYQLYRESVIGLQAAWRGRLKRHEYVSQRRAVTLLSSRYKGWQQRRKYVETKEVAKQQLLVVRSQRKCAAITIQSHLRSWNRRRYYHRIVKAMIQGQALVRMAQQRRRYKGIMKCVVKLQSVWRGVQSRRRIRGRISVQLLSAAHVPKRSRWSSAQSLYVYVSFVVNDVVFAEKRTVTSIARRSSFRWNTDGSVDTNDSSACCRSSSAVPAQQSPQMTFPAMSTPPIHARNAVELDFESFPQSQLKVEFALWRENDAKPPQLIGQCSHDVTAALLHRKPLHVVPTFPLSDGEGQPVTTTLSVMIDVKYATETVVAGLLALRPRRK